MSKLATEILGACALGYVFSQVLVKSMGIVVAILSVATCLAIAFATAYLISGGDRPNPPRDR